MCKTMTWKMQLHASVQVRALANPLARFRASPCILASSTSKQLRASGAPHPVRATPLPCASIATLFLWCQCHTCQLNEIRPLIGRRELFYLWKDFFGGPFLDIIGLLQRNPTMYNRVSVQRPYYIWQFLFCYNEGKYDKSRTVSQPKSGSTCSPWTSIWSSIWSSRWSSI